MRALLAILFLLTCLPAQARDNGQWANSPLKQWFDGLASGKGLCCSFADGLAIKDVDWDTHGTSPNSGYRVRIGGVWIEVPKDAAVTVPNKFGAAVVWPYVEDGKTLVRCFLPGGGA